MTSKYALENLLPVSDLSETWTHVRDFNYRPSLLECEYALHGLTSKGYRILIELDRQYAKSATLPPLTPDSFCSEEVREGDEYRCTRLGCGLRWDVHEERPLCPRRT